jgi:hypothetical protein
MLGITGHRMAYKGAADQLVSAPQNLVNVVFPQKTVVKSMQMVDDWGRPTYRKDIHV